MPQKPLTIARREFVAQMAELAAKSGLPASMLYDIFMNAAVQMQQLDNEQYEHDKAMYETELAKEKEQQEE